MPDPNSDESPRGVVSDSQSVPPDEAFALLGDETRIDILQALWETHEPYEADSGIAYSDLYELVDIDDTGNFTYHLEKLIGHFIRQTDTGYELTKAGFAIVQTVIAGSVHQTPTFDMAEVDAVCPQCEGQIAVSYDRERDAMIIRCTQCPGNWLKNCPPGTIFAFDMPPAGLRNRTPDDAFQAMLSWRLHRIETMIDGVCPVCAGTVDLTYTVCRDHDVGDDHICPDCENRFQSVIRYICSVCKESLRIPLLGVVLFHPAVTSFFYNRGIDHRIGEWDAIVRAHGYDQSVLSTDPLRIRVTVCVDEDDLQLTLNEDLAVISVST